MCIRDSQQGDRLVDALVEAIKDKLLKGHQVVLKDFAAIKVTEKKAQIVKDPETGHQYISPAENVVSFVPIDSFPVSYTHPTLPTSALV